MNEIQENGYILSFDRENQTIVYKGISRLPTLSQYEKIKIFLLEAASRTTDKLILDLRGLRFLNSSGITTLSMFVIQLREDRRIRLSIRASGNISWQAHSIHNLKKLWNEIDIEVDD